MKKRKVTPENKKKYIFVSIILWIIVWEVLDIIISNSILFAGPVEVILRLKELCLDGQFWNDVVGSLIRITIGFVTGMSVGIILAAMSYRFQVVRFLLEPPVAVVKAAPVASFVVLFLIWWKSSVLSVAISFFVVMPQIYISVLKGLNNTDRQLLEMAEVFGINRLKRIRYIYMPAVRPFFEGTVSVAIGLAWKSGVAAEVIGTPDNSIGGSLYMSKIYLDTSGVLAWTLVVILLSVCFERFVTMLVSRKKRPGFLHGRAGTKDNHSVRRQAADIPVDEYIRRKEDDNSVSLEAVKISKSFGDNRILNDYSVNLKSGDIQVYDWESGTGKTTLFRIIAGLEMADTGEVSCVGRIAYIFQEDRLLDHMTARENVSLVCNDDDKAGAVLQELIDGCDIDRPVSELSGGEKRRVAIARALSIDADILIADEPYNGLDEANRERVSRLFEKYAEGRIILMASHI